LMNDFKSNFFVSISKVPLAWLAENIWSSMKGCHILVFPTLGGSKQDWLQQEGNHRPEGTHPIAGKGEIMVIA
jgi:hypothetical protein